MRRKRISDGNKRKRRCRAKGQGKLVKDIAKVKQEQHQDCPVMSGTQWDLGGVVLAVLRTSQGNAGEGVPVRAELRLGPCHRVQSR